MTSKHAHPPGQGTASVAKLSFPKVNKVVLSNFTLFSLEREVTVEITDGIFCLAGANGLGKSTFLLAVTFGLTGIVPDRAFTSVDNYYTDSREFSSGFFSGRIGEHDRDTAEISLTVTVGEDTFCLTRGMFETDQLRAFVISDPAGNVLLDTAAMTPTDRHREYEEGIVSRTGLSSFQQLVFLQHFVLTFDERRHLLFWDQRALEQTLYLAFGIDPARAYQADVLRQKMQKAESHARNANWQANGFLKKIHSLRDTSKKLGSKKFERLQEEFEKLEGRKTAAEGKVDQLKDDLDDVQVALADSSAKHATLQDEYSRAFADHVARAATIGMHPVVVASKRDGSCSLCGSSRAGVVREIVARVAGRSCPLCGSTLGGSAHKKDVSRLRRLDSKLANAAQHLSEAVAKRQRLLEEVDESLHELKKAQVAINKFVADNAIVVEQVRAQATTGIQSIIKEYTARMNDFLAMKQDKYKERNRHRRKLEVLRRDLQTRYSAAEGTFLPMFTKLAGSFLGIELDVRLTTAQATGVTLVLDMRGSSRRRHHQLSESQRFFIDIALRMALAQFMSFPGSPANLYIDTPEGSLDVAYETKAGQMFSQFARNGFGILMTANINGSRLLTAMASRCGPRRMHLQRMTTWTELSDVQRQEEKLFEKVFKDIERSLARGGKRGKS